MMSAEWREREEGGSREGEGRVKVKVKVYTGKRLFTHTNADSSLSNSVGGQVYSLSKLQKSQDYHVIITWLSHDYHVSFYTGHVTYP